MKRLIAVLALAAVLAGALYAQDEGSWSVGGSGRIGTTLNFLPMEILEGGQTYARADGWDQWHDNVGASLNLTYRRGGLSTGFAFSQQNGATANLTFNGENFTVGAEHSANFLLGKNLDRTRLWGNYRFQVLNGITLEAAVARTGQQWWSTTGIFGDTFTHTKWDGGGTSPRLPNANEFDSGFSHNYLLLNASPIAGLSLGFALPNIFVFGADNWNSNVISDPLSMTNPDRESTGFLEKSLKYTVFGGRFDSGPLAVGVQFALRGEGNPANIVGDLRSAFYFGLSYGISPQMSANLEFRGLFGFQTDGKDAAGLRIGGSFNFNEGPFGAGVTIKYEDGDTVTEHDQAIVVEPSVRYDLVEGYLRFNLGTAFTFKERQDGADWVSVIDYSFTPQLYFNFLGTGAGGWSTGFAARYRVAGPAGYFEPNKGHNTQNFMELVFNWSF